MESVCFFFEQVMPLLILVRKVNEEGFKPSIFDFPDS